MSTGGVKTTNTLFSGQEVVGTIETWEILLKQNYKTKDNNSNKTQTFFTVAFFFFFSKKSHTVFALPPTNNSFNVFRELHTKLQDRNSLFI